MRKKDSGERLLDILAEGDSEEFGEAYVVAGAVVYELDTAKEENVSLKEQIAELEAQANHLRDATKMVPVSREALEALRHWVEQFEYGYKGSYESAQKVASVRMAKAARRLLDEP